MTNDIPTLYKHLSSKTRLDPEASPKQNGAFYNLLQHHGYPTPLLDWTRSPYIAAFFAYRGIGNTEASMAEDSEKVRIFVFDEQQWKTDYAQLEMLNLPFLHLSFMEFVSIDNERMLPQQAASSVTNIDDIEGYIKSKETPEKTYLRVIDLPKRERKEVMEELEYMGITASSLFPGLDGACEALKERFFMK